MKICQTCKQEKPKTEFGKSRNFPDGLCPRCKSCARVINKRSKEKHKEKWKARQKRYRESHPDKCRDIFLKNKFGITLKDYQDMAKSQNGRCAICGDVTKLVVDHCHTSGKVRELLCGGCNTALGLIREREEVTIKMRDYIIKHKEDK